MTSTLVYAPHSTRSPIFICNVEIILLLLCWYQNQVMGKSSIGKIIGKLMISAGYEGFYSGHSLRWSEGSRMFRAGVQRKLVKECTGHSSDAIDKYQITSEEQREAMSNILAHGPSAVSSQNSITTKSVVGSAVSHSSNIHRPPSVILSYMSSLMFVVLYLQIVKNVRPIVMLINQSLVGSLVKL